MTERIPIPDEDVVSLDHVAAGLSGLRILMVNVFLLSSDREWVLIDAGLPGSAGRIRRWVEERTGGQRPAYILLTHGHFDHVGAAADLAGQWDIPVYAHPLEAPYLNGRKKYPPPDPSVGGGLMAVLSPLYPDGPFNLQPRLRALSESRTLPGLAGWGWLHTPGHTEGHVSLFRQSDRTLIVGDAFCTTKAESFLAVAAQRPELHGPPAYYTPDWENARRSVELLSSLEPQIVAPGHGLPIAGPQVASELALLARRFEQVAVPDQGRYAPSGRR
jgi:glyoxylase-like metal-dependent hydrolase (beta-lactamase superfamily II)